MLGIKRSKSAPSRNADFLPCCVTPTGIFPDFPALPERVRENVAPVGLENSIIRLRSRADTRARVRLSAPPFAGDARELIAARLNHRVQTLIAPRTAPAVSLMKYTAGSGRPRVRLSALRRDPRSNASLLRQIERSSPPAFLLGSSSW